MRNKIRYIRLIGLIFVLIVGSSLTFAQNKSKRKSAKKPLVEVVSIVTDEKGSPLKNVSIICGEGAVVLYTCLLYTSPSPRDELVSRMPSSA